MVADEGGARCARFLRNSLEAVGQWLQVADLVWPDAAARSLCASVLSNCSCRLIALGAGFPRCFRPRKMGQPAAASSPAPGGFLGFQVASSRLVGLETKGSALTGGTSVLTVGFPRQLPRSERGQRVPNWLRLQHRVPLSPKPAGAVPTMSPGVGGDSGGPQPAAAW